MKKTVIVIAAVSVVSLILSSIFLRSVKKEDFNHWSLHFSTENSSRAVDPALLKDYKAERTFDFSKEGRLELRIAAGKIKVTPSQENKLKIRLKGKVDSTKDFNIDECIKKNGQTLRLDLLKGDASERGDWLNFSAKVSSLMPGDVEIEVEVPRNFEVLDIGGFSLEMDVRDLTPKKIDLKVVDGDIELERVQASSLIVSSVSGDIDFTDSGAEEMQVNSVSGDLEFESRLPDKYAIQFTSITGKMSGKELFEGTSSRQMKINTVSGDAKFVRK